mmetsp:Transcript_24730/g.38858  ORF Transcript_24730/g.38858 Transcript_24730/m.38858 type:complete len:303 (-) Transcript_24730:2321-3229(-)
MSSANKGLVVISGASRGIGRAIALALADAACVNHDKSSSSSIISSQHLHLVLMARSASSLQETTDMLQQRCEKGGSTIVTTTCHEMDLADIDSLPQNVNKILEPLADENYNSCLLINNAGSLGPLGNATAICGDEESSAASLRRWKDTIDFNITSSLWISSKFAKATSHVPLVRVVNISSLCAIDPFPTMSLYCAGKAARDMFHSVLAKEQTPPQIDGEGTAPSTSNPARFKVLNYAPGACNTEMTDFLAGSADLDNELQHFFFTSKDKGQLVRPDDTASKLVSFLMKDEFESGIHVDYWDV